MKRGESRNGRVHLVVAKAADKELEDLSSILGELRDSRDPDETADCAFRFYHELATLSGNVLLPLMYYSFMAPMSTSGVCTAGAAELNRFINWSWVCTELF